MGQSLQRKLVYLPVERYASRWTDYVSGAAGMFARCCKEAGVSLQVIAPHDELLEIKSGVVLDTNVRAWWCFEQMEQLLRMVRNGEITNDTVIYFEDFWTFGMEALPYACHLAGVHPKIYAFCHAQSVDPNDFTYHMRHWMRDFEIGWANCLDGIFVADLLLAEWLTKEGVCDKDKIHATGTVYNRQYVVDHYLKTIVKPRQTARLPRVLFTSRFDREKDPDLFIALAKRLRHTKWEFLMLSGRPVEQVESLTDGLRVLQVDKAHYFWYLATSAVMVNCAKQDFVGYCQLDALACGCAPLCPGHLTFPDLLKYDPRYLYYPGNLDSLADKLSDLMKTQLEEPTLGDIAPSLWEEFGAKYDKSVERMIEVMFA